MRLSRRPILPVTNTSFSFWRANSACQTYAGIVCSRPAWSAACVTTGEAPQRHAQGELFRSEELLRCLLTILRVSRFCSVEGGLESGFVLVRKRGRKDFATQALQFFQYPVLVRGGPSR